MIPPVTSLKTLGILFFLHQIIQLLKLFMLWASLARIELCIGTILKIIRVYCQKLILSNIDIVRNGNPSKLIHKGLHNWRLLLSALFCYSNDTNQCYKTMGLYQFSSTYQSLQLFCWEKVEIKTPNSLPNNCFVG